MSVFDLLFPPFRKSQQNIWFLSNQFSSGDFLRCVSRHLGEGGGAAQERPHILLRAGKVQIPVLPLSQGRNVTFTQYGQGTELNVRKASYPD